VDDEPYPADAFDAVTLCHAIEHLPDPARALGAVHRMLRPGGRLAILTPNARSLGHRWFRSSWFALDPPRHVCVFTPAALSRLLAAADFRVTYAVTSQRGAAPILTASRTIRRTGRADESAPPGWARAAEWGEWLAVAAGAGLGEEIAVVAEKQGHEPPATSSSVAR
jgi:SAM-dependent methyltransferase